MPVIVDHRLSIATNKLALCRRRKRIPIDIADRLSLAIVVSFVWRCRGHQDARDLSRARCIVDFKERGSSFPISRYPKAIPSHRISRCVMLYPLWERELLTGNAILKRATRCNRIKCFWWNWPKRDTGLCRDTNQRMYRMPDEPRG